MTAPFFYQNDQLKSVTTPGATYNFTYGNFGLRTGVKVGTQSLATYSYIRQGTVQRQGTVLCLDTSIKAWYS